MLLSIAAFSDSGHKELRDSTGKGSNSKESIKQDIE